MSAAAVTEEQWLAVRSMLARTGELFCELLRTVRDPGARTTGDWGIAETAAHTTVVCAMDVYTATFGEVPFPDAEVLALIETACVDDIAGMNALSLRRFPERDPHKLADEVERGVVEILRRTADGDGTAVGPWMGGSRMSVAGMLAHLLNELLLHGLDIARAEGRRWDIPAEAAALTFQVFILDVLRRDSGRLLQYHAPKRTGVVRAELRSRHHPPLRLDAAHGRLRLGGADGPLDVRIWNDPVALMLMVWGRTGRARPVLTGRIAIWGRRPWRVFRFLDAIGLP